MRLSNKTASVANTIIYESSVSFNNYISNMKLQKLFYFSFGRCLVELETEITEELFEAWPYGCVIPSLYNQYKKYKEKHVRHFAFDSNGKQPIIDRSHPFSMKIYTVIKQVLSEYVKMSSFRLSEMNHEVDGAWWNTKKKKERTVKIEDIRCEFEKRRSSCR